MNKEKQRELRRQELIAVLSEHVLAEGLPAMSLRPLAAAAGTSDRMLLYYFQDKEDLLTALLTAIAGQLREQLDELAPEAMPFERLLGRVSELVRTAQLGPYMQLWLEIAALAARGQEPYRTIGGGIADGFLEWVVTRLEVRRGVERQKQGALLLALIEGQLLFDSFGRPNIGNLARKACKP